ncbi:MAG: AAA family ATPase [Verrucomicrobia bacterium]|nr:AAA family ATPase [Verrucomicrobiota bacterium]
MLIGTLLTEGLEGVDGAGGVWERVRCIEDRPAEDLFTLIALHPLWDWMRARARAGRDFSRASLSADHSGRTARDAAGGAQAVSELTGLPVEQLGVFAQSLAQFADARSTLNALDDAKAMIVEAPERVGTVAGTAVRMLESVAKPREVFPPPVKLGEWLAKPRPPRPTVIHGMLRQGDKLTLGGSSKSKKTWFLADLALCVSAGATWMGLETVKCPVLYLNLELHEHDFAWRLEQICRAASIDPRTADFTPWNLRGNGATVERIEEAIGQLRRPFGLVVLDPLYKMLGGRVENAAEDVADLLAHLERITARHNCALAIAAHYSKGNQSEKESIDRISGSGVFARDADAILTMTAHEQPDCFTVAPTLRAFAPLPSFVARWDFPRFRRDDGMDPGALKKAVGRKPKVADEELLALIPAEGLTWTAWRNAAVDRLGISLTTTKDRISALRLSGKVRQAGPSELYFKAGQ